MDSNCETIFKIMVYVIAYVAFKVLQENCGIIYFVLLKD